MITRLDYLEKSLETVKQERATKTQIQDLRQETLKEMNDLKVQVLDLKVLLLSKDK